MLNLCLTFDYELFFGECKYSVEDVLLAPTRKIVSLLDNMGVEGTFFGDSAMCIRHREFGLDTIADSIDKQMEYVFKCGHDVQLHIHPAWFKSVYNNKEWRFNNSYYRLHSFFDEMQDVQEIFQITKKYIEDVLKPLYIYYHCVAFRAGGFCIQPEKEILDIMEKCELRIDSSVCKKLVAKTSSHYYDYSITPKKCNWFFSKKSGICKEDKRGCFFEVPVGSVYKLPQKWILVHGNPKLTRERLKGKVSNDTDIKNSRMKFLKKAKAFFSYGVMMSMDSSHYLTLKGMCDAYLNQFDCRNNDIYVCLIGHPKLFGESNFLNLEKFIHIMKAEYHDTVRFVTINDIYNKEVKDFR